MGCIPPVRRYLSAHRLRYHADGLCKRATHPPPEAAANSLNSELGAKQIALFHELLPSVPTIGFLGNPSNQIDELMTTAVVAAAAAIGLRIQTLKAATAPEIDAAFERLVQARTEALLVCNDAFLNSQYKQIIALAARLAIPVMYGSSEFVVAGGLVSYGASLTEIYRQLGLYAGRILKGASAAELPIIQSRKLAWSSISRPPSCSASQSRTGYSPSLMR